VYSIIIIISAFIIKITIRNKIQIKFLIFLNPFMAHINGSIEIIENRTVQ